MTDRVDLKSLLIVSEVEPWQSSSICSYFIAQHNQGNAYGSLFGGQILGQAVLAASSTVPDRDIHSLHAYFLAPGTVKKPVRYHVEHTRQGRSFVNRTVVASQDHAICTMSCSFRLPEAGWRHQAPMPEAPQPEELEDIVDIVRRRDPSLPAQLVSHFAGDNPIELRPVSGQAALEVQEDTSRRSWMRVPSLAGSDQVLHRAALAWLSDYWISSAGLVLHRHPLPGPDILLASIDHSLWIYRAVQVDEWLFCDADSPWAGDGTALVRANFYNRRGELVASAAQEVLQRLR